jgi:hypothetical protein
MADSRQDAEIDVRDRQKFVAFWNFGLALLILA